MKSTENKQHITGFTLTELLVVVIIVALLSAVSFGYYKKSVEQTRSTEGLTAAATLSEAINRAYLDDQLEGNLSPAKRRKIGSLDIGIANAGTCSSNTDYCLSTRFFEVNNDTNGVVRAYRGTVSSYKYYLEIQPHFAAAAKRDRIACVGNDTNGRDFCESIGYIYCTSGGVCTKENR